MYPIFIPEHYPEAAWAQRRREGCQAHLYLPAADPSNLDAEDILREAWGMFVSCDSLADSYSTIAKVTLPDGRAACLRMDRDFYQVAKKDRDGLATLVCWQFSSPFRGFRQDELWSNMAALVESAGDANP